MAPTISIRQPDCAILVTLGYAVLRRIQMVTRESRLIDLLQAKYSEDPKGFSDYLPGAAELLPEEPPKQSRPEHPVRLTERKLSCHRAGLSAVLGKMDEGAITAEEAVKGLQHCAALIKDDNLHYGWDENLSHEMGHEVKKGLLRAALSKSPGSYKSKTTVPICEDSGGPVLESISVIRGVYLNLDSNERLVSIYIHPGKYRERRKLMEFVGASRDPMPDVALRHDDYLYMADPHGNA